jgi:8-amino-7-oxononanoate synthase
MPTRITTNSTTRCWKMNPAELYLRRKIDERIAAGNLRSLSTEKLAADFYSNDYLGFITNGILDRRMAAMANASLTTGSTGSRLLSGNSNDAEKLEAAAARFHDAEAALLFNSGYNANTGLIAAVAGRESTILYDALSHASIIDGVRLSQARHKHKFGHNDLNELESLLQRSQDGNPVIVIVESVYSMDGCFAPLKAIAGLCNTYHAALIVDEAHGTGVFGANGQGLVHELGLQGQVFARVHTFGKAMGCHGAVVAGSRELTSFLINFARPFIYTTALPGHSVQAALAAYACMSDVGFSHRPLHDLIQYFRGKIAGSALEWLDSASPIQGVVIPGNEPCRAVAQQMAAQGIQTKAILSPTVPAGAERIRLCLHLFNTTEQVDRLFSVLSR